MWLRQGSDTRISVELAFNTQKVPEPSNLLGITFLLGLATLTIKRKLL